MRALFLHFAWLVISSQGRRWAVGGRSPSCFVHVACGPELNFPAAPRHLQWNSNCFLILGQNSLPNG